MDSMGSFLLESLCNNIGRTVTIFTTSGGVSGSGFTGVLLTADREVVRLLCDVGAPPACPVGSSCTSGFGPFGSFGNDFDFMGNPMGAVAIIPNTATNCTQLDRLRLGRFCSCSDLKQTADKPPPTKNNVIAKQKPNVIAGLTDRVGSPGNRNSRRSDTVGQARNDVLDIVDVLNCFECFKYSSPPRRDELRSSALTNPIYYIPTNPLPT